MAGPDMRCLVFAFALAMIFLLASSVAPDAKCGGHEALVQLVNVTVACDKYIDKNNKRVTGAEEPPEECCDALRRGDLPCLCGNIPKVFEQYASMDSFIYAAGKCSPQLRSVATCGTYTIGWSSRGAHAIEAHD